MTFRFVNFFLLASCSSGNFELMTDAVAQENQIVQKKYNLVPFGFGTIGPGEIKAYTFDQNIRLQADISTARRLLINYVEDLKYQINIYFVKKKLHEPIDENFLSIGINFMDDLGHRIIKEGMVSRVTQNDGLIRYKILSEDKCNYNTLYEESYEEALKIVNQADL